MRQALAGNRTLAEANATLAQAQASELRPNRRSLLPTLDATAGVQRERINLASFGFSAGGLRRGDQQQPGVHLYSVGATANYPLDLFGGTRRRIESVRARARPSRARATRRPSF